VSARLARTAEGWWVVTPTGLVRLDLPAATTAGLLADRAAPAIPSLVIPDQIAHPALSGVTQPHCRIA